MRLMVYMLRMKIKQSLVERVAFINNIWIQFYAYSVTLLNLLILLSKVNMINGWNFSELLLLWAINVFSYGISGLVVYTGCGKLEQSIQTGEFDIVLTKPVSSFWFHMLSHVNVTFFFHICFSVFLLIYVFIVNNVEISLVRLMYTVVLLSCAVILQSCIMIILASTSFWIIKSNDIINTAIYGLRGLCNYPVTIYSTLLQVVLFCVVPYGFISYIPSVYILNKDLTDLNRILVGIQPLFTLGVLVCTKVLWKQGVKSYSSTGN